MIGAKLIPLDQAPISATSSESHVTPAPVIDELRETIGKMEVALNEIEDSIVWTDGTGEVRWCNKAFDQLVGRNQLCFCVGAVSGKGVPAALFMAVVKTMIRDYAYGGKNRTAGIVRETNREMCCHNPASMFCSLFIGILNIKSGLLVYTNAGHNPPLFMKNGSSFELIKDKHGPVVGAFEESMYDEGTIQMERGDALLVYTDGVTEATDQKGDWYTVDRLRGFLKDQQLGAPSGIVSAVADDVQRFKGGAQQADDITMICLQYRG